MMMLLLLLLLLLWLWWWKRCVVEDVEAYEEILYATAAIER